MSARMTVVVHLPRKGLQLVRRTVVLTEAIAVEIREGRLLIAQARGGNRVFPRGAWKRVDTTDTSTSDG